MDDARHNTQGRHSWFAQHIQLLRQHNADATREEIDNRPSTSNEVIITNYFFSGLRIYMRNALNNESENFPGSFDFIACNPQAVNIKRFDGREAIVRLMDGRLVVRLIRKSKKRGRIDLHDCHRGPNPIITPEVDTLWAAPICYCMPHYSWEEMMARGKVKILRDLRQPGDAGEMTARPPEGGPVH